MNFKPGLSLRWAKGFWLQTLGFWPKTAERRLQAGAANLIAASDHVLIELIKTC